MSSSPSTPRQPPAPPHPHFVLRGHSDQIHTVCFAAGRSAAADSSRLLLSGDAHGFIVLWKLSTRRPLAVWRAHDGAVLRLSEWNGSIIRDHKLYVWQLPPGLEQSSAAESGLSRELPVEAAAGPEQHRQRPWLLHAIDVNALNFCAFAQCHLPVRPENGQAQSISSEGGGLAIAVPAASLDSDAIDVFHLPSQARIASIPSSAPAIKTGMVMALCVYVGRDNKLSVVGGFESGHILIFEHQAPFPGLVGAGTVGGGPSHSQQQSQSQWQAIATLQPHSQPVLSLDLTPDLSSVLSSSADANLAKIALRTGELLRVSKTGHAGQQSLVVRDDGLVFATAGWDGRCRVYETESLKELAVLKWHNEGCYAVAFSAVAARRDTPRDISEVPNGQETLGEQVQTGQAADQQGGQAQPQMQTQTQADPGKAPTKIAVASRSQTHALQAPAKATDHRQNTTRRRRTLLPNTVAVGSKDGKVSLWEIY